MTPLKETVVMFLKSTITMAELNRVVKIGVFKDDERDDFYGRYVRKLCDGVEGSILNRLLKLLRDEEDKNGIGLLVEIEPHGHFQLHFEHCEINNVTDLCDKLAELSLMVLKRYRRDND
jgi:hypothetical protein